MAKFLSRKFLICVAAFLGSIGTSIAALHTDNQIVATMGIICAMLSAAIYATAEAHVDAAAVDKGVEIVDEIEVEEDEDDGDQ